MLKIKKYPISILCCFEKSYLDKITFSSLESFFNLSITRDLNNLSTDRLKAFDIILINSDNFLRLETVDKKLFCKNSNLQVLLLTNLEETLPVKLLTNPFISNTIILKKKNHNLKEAILKNYCNNSKSVKKDNLKLSLCYEKDQKDRSELITKLDNIIENSIECAEISTEFIANNLYMTPTTLCRKIKKYIGVTTVQYILYKRLLIAELLLNEGNTVQETAVKTGFLSISYFSKSFKKQFSICPSQYVKLS